MRRLLLCLILYPLAAIAADEQQLPNQMCAEAEAAFRTVRGGLVTRNQGVFQDDYDKFVYRGCIVGVNGNRNQAPDYYRIIMKFYASRENGLMQRGWRNDRESDGPDGTSWVLYKDPVYCQVSGSWDGGDDSEPAYKPKPEFKLRIECGVRQ